MGGASNEIAGLAVGSPVGARLLLSREFQTQRRTAIRRRRRRRRWQRRRR